MRRFISPNTSKSDLQRQCVSDPLFHGISVDNKTKAVIMREMNDRIRNQYRTATRSHHTDRNRNTAKSTSFLLSVGVLLLIVILSPIFIAFQSTQYSLKQNIDILESKLSEKENAINLFQAQLQDIKAEKVNLLAKSRQNEDAVADTKRKLNALKTERASIQKELKHCHQRKHKGFDYDGRHKPMYHELQNELMYLQQSLKSEERRYETLTIQHAKDELNLKQECETKRNWDYRINAVLGLIICAGSCFIARSSHAIPYQEHFEPPVWTVIAVMVILIEFVVQCHILFVLEAVILILLYRRSKEMEEKMKWTTLNAVLETESSDNESEQTTNDDVTEGTEPTDSNDSKEEEEDDTDSSQIQDQIPDDPNENTSNDDSGEVSKKLLDMIGEVPDKVEDCNKVTFFFYLLLLVEQSNAKGDEKIDYLSLFQFLSKHKAFDFNSILPFGGEFMSKLSAESLLKLFETTEFDTDKLSQIFDILRTNDTTDTIKMIKENINSFDVDQIWETMSAVSATGSSDNESDQSTDDDTENTDSTDSKDSNEEEGDVNSSQTQNGKKSKIEYKIRDFAKLVKYLGTKFNAPEGSNRNGIGAEKYANAQMNGPGGNLSKFIEWDKKGLYGMFHGSHYDWWMFPSDRGSSHGKKYTLFQEDIDKLVNEVDGYLRNYRLGTSLVLKSWGWDMTGNRFYDEKEKTKEQKWTGYNVRLLKMLYSTIILKQWDEYKSVYLFCIGLLEKGEEFRSEPMMYEYLGLEKPKFER